MSKKTIITVTIEKTDDGKFIVELDGKKQIASSERALGKMIADMVPAEIEAE